MEMIVLDYLLLAVGFGSAFVAIGYEERARLEGWPVGEWLSGNHFMKPLALVTIPLTLGIAFYEYEWWSPIAVFVFGSTFGMASYKLLGSRIQDLVIAGTFVGIVTFWIIILGLFWHKETPSRAEVSTGSDESYRQNASSANTQHRRSAAEAAYGDNANQIVKEMVRLHGSGLPRMIDDTMRLDDLSGEGNHLTWTFTIVPVPTRPYNLDENIAATSVKSACADPETKFRMEKEVVEVGRYFANDGTHLYSIELSARVCGYQLVR